MLLTPEEQAERDAQARQRLREAGSVADQLAGLDHRAHLAAVRGDFDAFADSAEQLLTLHARFAEAYRHLLMAWVRQPRPPLPQPEIKAPTLAVLAAYQSDGSSSC